jgi:hypothetical protein
MTGHPEIAPKTQKYSGFEIFAPYTYLFMTVKIRILDLFCKGLIQLFYCLCKCTTGTDSKSDTNKIIPPCMQGGIIGVPTIRNLASTK